MGRRGEARACRVTVGRGVGCLVGRGDGGGYGAVAGHQKVKSLGCSQVGFFFFSPPGYFSAALGGCQHDFLRSW